MNDSFGTVTNVGSKRNNMENTGWICPICGAALNPTVTECPNCKHREGTIKYVPFIPTPNYYRYPGFGPYPGYDLIWTC